MDRETQIRKLKVDLANGHVVTVVGTGVSVAACGNQEVEGFKVATWTGLLQHGVKHCKDIGMSDDDEVRLLTDQIQTGKTDFLISAAEIVTQRLRSQGSGRYLGWLKDTVGQLKVKDRSVLDAVVSLPGVLATLNYDNLIEDLTGRHAVPWIKADQVQEVLRREGPDAVLHLHGWFREPDSIVLGLRSYLAVKDHPHARAVLELFTVDRTLLFIGCGDTLLDPNFTRLIEWAKEAHAEVAPRHVLLCRESELNGLQRKLEGAPWLQPLAYGANYADLVSFLSSLSPMGGVRLSPRTEVPSLDFAPYQQAMRRRYSHLKLDELDPTTHDLRTLTLTGMFIVQSARECAEFMPRVFELPKETQRRLREAGEMDTAEFDAELIAQQRRAYFDQSPRPVLDIVGDPAFQRLVILGDPGCGKSTLLQFLILTWAEKAASVLAGEPLPLLIELREYGRLRAEGTAIGFLQYLHRGESVRCHIDQVQLDAWLKVNTSLILFDGLDEIFDLTLRREVSTAIHRFADNYPLARILVTSRIIGYQHQAWRDEDFRHFMLQDLDEAQIADFLARWHRVAYEDCARGEAKRALLASAIKDSAAIRQLAGNPLLLTMMAILNRTQDLPRDRVRLYERCAELLLYQWKADEALNADPVLKDARLDFADKRSLLLLVAGAMQSSESGLAGNLIDEHTLQSTLEMGLRAMTIHRPDRAARALIEHLRGRNFMLCSMGGRSYAFVHRTFLEYFCALEIDEWHVKDRSLTDEDLWEKSFRHWADETWHEVLCLLAGMLNPQLIAQMLAWLLIQPDPADSCHSVFLAVRCVGEVRNRTELGSIEQDVQDRVKALTRFDLRYFYQPLDDDVRTVRSIRSRAVRAVAAAWPHQAETLHWLKARAQSDEDSAVRIAAVQELARGWKEDPATLPWLKVRAESDENGAVRIASVQELARGWKEDPATLPLLRERIKSDDNLALRQAAVQELARGWKEDPATLPWLKEHAQSDGNWAVRQAVVQELTRGWKEDPATLPLLKERANSDENGAVRQAAVQELARGWKEDPATLPLLKERTESDEDEDVRQAAVQELARGWKEDPATLPWLNERAQSDEDGFVRQAAVQELARGWKEDPATLTLLKERAQLDEDGFVRQAAVQELARGWKEDPATLTLLKERAQLDEDGFVRQAAVRELARGWKEDPATLPLLKERAQSDENWAVRHAAVQELARGWKEVPTVMEFINRLGK